MARQIIAVGNIQTVDERWRVLELYQVSPNGNVMVTYECLNEEPGDE